MSERKYLSLKDLLIFLDEKSRTLAQVSPWVKERGYQGINGGQIAALIEDGIVRGYIDKEQPDDEDAFPEYSTTEAGRVAITQNNGCEQESLPTRENWPSRESPLFRELVLLRDIGT